MPAPHSDHRPTGQPTDPATLRVVPLTAEEHLEFLARHTEAGGSASFLQTPGWGRLKVGAGWRASSVGWRTPSGDTVGAGLVLHRLVPRQKRWSLAYLPEGPVIDWTSDDLGAWLDPLVAHLRAEHCFGIRMGPMVPTALWDADAVKKGVADADVRRLTDLAPGHRPPVGAGVVSRLRALGWVSQATEDGFGAGQPRYTYEVPLSDTDGAPLDEDAVLRQMNQQWRRNIKKAAKAGVEVTSVAPGGEPGAAAAEIEAFHALYVHTAERDGFTPRPLSYFRSMAEHLGREDPDRIRFFSAHHEGDLVASSITIRVGGRVWYAYGASSTEKRDVRGSNALQWAMMRYALEAGATVYDLRGITSTLDDDDPHVGLIRFKVGTGGRAVEYAGEWDLPLNRVLYRAFDLYMSRR